MSLPIPPLMHGAGQFSIFRSTCEGNTAVIVDKFDAEETWRLVEKHHINMIGVTGDAMARPLADALEKMQGDVDLSSLFSFSSTAAIFSQTVKEQLAELLPDGLVMSDAIGSTESGMNGIRMVQKGDAPKEGITTVVASADTVVLDDDLNPLEPGTGVVGRLARGGNIPLGYYNDPEKTAATFVTDSQGRRWSIPGDYALLEADGRITLLGRGSVSINSGGEKIYPEEVEGALKSHPDVFDVLVVGMPDERWGERVAALLQPREGKVPNARGAAGALPQPDRGLQGAARIAARGADPAARRTASPTTAAPRTRRGRSPRPTERHEPDARAGSCSLAAFARGDGTRLASRAAFGGRLKQTGSRPMVHGDGDPAMTRRFPRLLAALGAFAIACSSLAGAVGRDRGRTHGGRRDGHHAHAGDGAQPAERRAAGDAGSTRCTTRRPTCRRCTTT